MTRSARAAFPVDLSGQVAVVTGGGVRLGAAIARALATQGAAVAIHYSSSSSAALQVASEIRAAGGRAELFCADFADRIDACGQLMQEVANALGTPSILVNNAAIFEEATLAGMDEAAWDRALQINLKAPAFLCQAFAAAAHAGPSRHIVNIVDWRATHPCPGHLPYTVAKAGLAALTHLLAAELGGSGVRVNAIAPGAILPPPGASPEHMSRLADRTLLGRTGGPEDIVQAVMYLLSANFVTGQILYVTGGEQLRRP